MKKLKKLLCIFAVICLLLCGCRKNGENSIETGADIPTISEPSSNIAPDTSSKKPGASSAMPSTSSEQGGASSSNPSSSNTSSTNVPSFNPQAGRTYHYYENLNDEQKRIYEKINDAALNMKSGMISLGKTSVRDISLAFSAVRTDHPEYFWIPYSYINKIEGDNYYIAIDYESDQSSVSFLCTKNQKQSMEAALKRKVAEIKKLVPAGASDYEIELILHDYLCSKVTYMDTGANEMSYTAYGALVEGQALCEGYARAMQLLCNEFSIPCTLVCGTSAERGENHMWNMIKIGGEWYNLDVTWDDDDHNRLVTHRYFNITDLLISKTHIVDPDFYALSTGDFGSGTVPSYNFSLPSCNSTKYHYPNQAGCTLTENAETSKNIICSVMKAAADKKAEYCEFYLSYDPSSGTTATILAEKYALQNCKNVVNLNSKHKITGMSVALTGRTFIVFLNYGG